ncbi:GIDE domain-containing protein [Halostella litorea]|uniref:GIDE domain-containing protein n=1 Tax=Halostella litorea TaxID=2528831 RepID=UPI001092419F|nr:GIDE domain-containing protein [Halostella litorea]
MGSPLAVGPFSNAMLIGAVLTVGFGAFGLVTLYRGVNDLGRGYRIMSNDPVDAGSVHLESGVVEVQGTAEPIDGTLDAAYTETDCLAYEYEEKHKHEDHDDDGNEREEWRTVDSGGDETPFYVTDDTGSVAVDPDGAEVSVHSDRVDSSIRVRKYEGRLDPGETVHVYGEKVDAADTADAPGDERVYIGDGGTAESFTISDTTENRTIMRYLGKGVATTVIGVVTLGAASVPTLTYTGHLSSVREFASQYLPLLLA